MTMRIRSFTTAWLTVLSIGIGVYAGSLEENVADLAVKANEVRSDREFVLGITNESVLLLVIAVPLLTIGNESWEGLSTPVVLRRNLTVRGSEALPSWPIIQAPVYGKVQLAAYTSLRFERVILESLRNTAVDNLPRVPGLDLLAPSRPGAQGAMLVVQDAAVVMATCYPTTEIREQNIAGQQRPSGIPGNQSYNINIEQPGCVNSTSVPYLLRCWDGRAMIFDLALAGADPAANGVPHPNHYGLWLLDVVLLCRRQLPLDCVKAYGPLGCLVSLSGNATVYGASGELAPQVPSAAGTGPSRDTVVIAAVLGSVAGAALLTGAAVLAFIMFKRRRNAAMVPDYSGVSMGGSRSALTGQHRRAVQDEGPTSEGCPAHPKSGDDLNEDLESSHRDTIVSGLESPNIPVTSHTPFHPTLDLHIDIQDPAQKGAGPRALRAEAEAAQPDSKPNPNPHDPGEFGFNVRTSGGRTTGRSGDSCPAAETGPEVVQLLSVRRGSGSFGQVVEGMYRGQRVAVKMVDPGLLLPPEAGGANADGYSKLLIATYRQEIEVLGRCQHPNIVRLLAACVRPPRIGLVLELMETSLDKLLQAHRKHKLLPMDMVFHIGIEVARGLEYLHPTIIHRDLKPANVLINNPTSDRPIVKLTDFGLSRLRETMLFTVHPDAGTPRYMAPECFDATALGITHKSDIYSFGVLLWELLSGVPPWGPMGVLEIAKRVCSYNMRLPMPDDSLPIASARWPLALRTMLGACWERDPRRRPAAAEIVKLLEAMRQDFGSYALPSRSDAEGTLPPPLSVSNQQGTMRQPGDSQGENSVLTAKTLVLSPSNEWIYRAFGEEAASSANSMIVVVEGVMTV